MKHLLVLLFWAVSFSLFAQHKEYKASMFGIKSNGYTLNTNSIQKAIDFISESGGGQLTFWVGRYRTGTIYLKSNVTIELREGAALISSLSPYDYDYEDRAALIVAKDQEKIRIFGNGLIDGEGLMINKNMDEQMAKGNLVKNRQPFRPALIYMDNCLDVSIEGILLHNAGGNVQEFTKCNDVRLSGLTIASKINPETNGIVLDGCNRFILKDSYIETSSASVLLEKRKSGNVKFQNNTAVDKKEIEIRRKL